MKFRQYALCLLLACLTACQQSSPPSEPNVAPAPQAAPPQPKAIEAELPPRDPADTVDFETRIPGNYKGNYVWAAATNLAWREMMDSILHGPAQMKDLNASAQKTLQSLNESKFSKRDLDTSSYYVKAGFGDEALAEIKSQMARKFPQVDPELDDIGLEPMHFIAYACLYKKLRYAEPFEPDSVSFQGKEVYGFSSAVLYDKLRIVDYRSDDDFVIQVLLKEKRDQLFLCKGFRMDSPGQALQVIASNKGKEPSFPASVDRFRAPKLHLEFNQSFEELYNHAFVNEGFAGYFLADMQESIKFDMDEKGVKLVAIGRDAIKGGEPPKPKHFYLDQPYWVILKRTDSPRPYFILGVRNTAMMKTIPQK